jgi:hypothetical protein
VKAQPAKQPMAKGQFLHSSRCLTLLADAALLGSALQWLLRHCTGYQSRQGLLMAGSYYQFDQLLGPKKQKRP